MPRTGSDRLRDFGVERPEPADRRGGVGPVGGGVRCVGPGQRFADRPGHRDRIVRVQPDMRVDIGAFLVFVAFLIAMSMSMAMIVIVQFPKPALAQLEEPDALGVLKRKRNRLAGQVPDDFCDGLFERRPGPDHHLRLGQHTRLRRPQADAVRRHRTAEEQGRRADAVHDRSDQRVNRLDRDDHPRRLGAYRRAGSGKSQEGGLWRPSRPSHSGISNESSAMLPQAAR